MEPVRTTGTWRAWRRFWRDIRWKFRGRPSTACAARASRRWPAPRRPSRRTRATPWDRKPPEMADSTVGWRFTNPKMPKEWTISLGETAEVVAQQYGITRDQQDALALESQRRTQRALEQCVFKDEMVPVDVGRTVVDRDEHPRSDVTLESLAKLKPAFTKDGTVTAGTARGINDGAAALLVLSDRPTARPPERPPLARI